jgi:hypothetical protein
MKFVLFVLTLAYGGQGWAATSLPVVFVPNVGQAYAPVRYVAETSEVRAAFLDDGVLLEDRGAQVHVRFQGVTDGRPEGRNRLDARVNLLRGNDPLAWHSEVPAFAAVAYPGIYPGIDAIYGGSGPRLKSEFRVAPGADPLAIRLKYEGATEVRVEQAGSLYVRAGAIELREFAPVLYSEMPNGTHQPVAGGYRVYEDKSVGFEIGPYDQTLPLVIDPTISYSTYLGGSGTGAVTGVARDAQGNLYAAGWTDSTNFPIAGALQASLRGSVDAFVVKLDPTGTSLIYATYIGGSGDDRAAGIAVDSSGQVYVAGATGSSNFPLSSPARGTFVGGKEGFALKLNAAGSAFVYSTYVGGSAYDVATAVSVDSSGNAYVAGDTYSTDLATLNPVQGSLGGTVDAFVTKLDTSGNVTFSTYLGGALDEHAGGIAAGTSGAVYIAGGTFSNNFPISAAIQPVNAGGQDGFVTKIQTTGTPQLLFSTYVGGSGGSMAAPEQANAIAVDGSGNSYITGVVSSSDFPVSAGALQSTLSGGRDIFITKLNAAGSVRVYSTYLGSTGFDWASGIGVDSSGNAYICGQTSSVGFTVVNALQTGFKGLYDGFVTELNASGGALLFSTMYGGSGSDGANAIAVDASGNIFVGGQTQSYNFPTQSALQSSNVSGNAGWLAKFGTTAPPPQLPSADSVDVIMGTGGTATVTAQFSHPAGASALTNASVLLSRTASVDFACLVSYDSTSNTFSLANDVASSGSTPVAAGGSVQNGQCQLKGGSRSISGNTLTLTISLVLASGFPGTTTVYLRAADASNDTGWVAKVGISAVTADTVSPNSGGGASDVFTFVFSDTKNATNVQASAMLIGTDTSGVNACWMVFDRARGTISLLFDSPTGSNAKPFGSTANIHNSQCAVGAPSMSISGTSTILTIPLAFYGAFTGPKNIYMYAVGPNGNTGWMQRGTYSVVAGGRPTADSVTPSAGSGLTQSFSFTLSDQGGSQFLWAAAMLFSRSSNFDLNNGCYILWDRTTSKFSLFKDTYTNGSYSLSVGASGLLGNSQCIVSGTGSTVSFGATSITITVNITFSASFAGAKNSFLYASENGYNSGWRQVGTWTVPGSPPTVISLGPTSGSGLTQNFTMTATTPVSPTDLTGMAMLFSSGGVVNTCYIGYDRATSTIGLYNDAATAVATKGIGSSAPLQNSQCAIGYSVANFSGNTASVTVQVVFKSPAFSGMKTVYVNASNPWGYSTMSAQGTWTVP